MAVFIDIDGDPYINFPVAAGNYHVALRHRDHLGVMTSSPRAMSVNPSVVLVNFFKSSSGVYGANGRVQRGSVYCLWAGDVNFDGTARYVGNNNDRDPILSAIGGSTPTATVSNVYSPLDLNMDGVIKYMGTGNELVTLSSPRWAERYPRQRAVHSCPSALAAVS